MTLQTIQRQIGDLADLETNTKSDLVATINEARKGEDAYKIGAGLKLDAKTHTLAVDTADAVERDNTKPVTSAAVHTEIGNIEVLLAAI